MAQVIIIAVVAMLERNSKIWNQIKIICGANTPVLGVKTEKGEPTRESRYENNTSSGVIPPRISRQHSTPFSLLSFLQNRSIKRVMLNLY